MHRPLHLVLAALLATAASIPSRAQWQILDAQTTADLRGIHAVSDGIAWASGTEGTVLRTADNGQTWQRCTTPPAAEHLDFRGIQAFDAATAIVMSSGRGDLSRLYKTTDSCQTWKLVFTNPDKEGFWDAIQFDRARERKGNYPPHDPCFGTLIGDPVDGRFVIFLTFNCGEHWARQIMQIPATKPREAVFAASNSALVVSDLSHREFVTGGVAGARLCGFGSAHEDTMPLDPSQVAPGAKEFHFQRRSVGAVSLPRTARTDSSGAFSLATNGRRDVIVGGDYKRPDSSAATAWYFKESNFISTPWFTGTPPKPPNPWHQAQTPPHGYRSAVAYAPTHKTWITVGPNGTDISTDDGKNWRPLKPHPESDSNSNDPPDADRNWNALSLPFVVGPHGRIGRLRPEALTKAP